MKKIHLANFLVILGMTLLTPVSAACPFDEAGVEVTIMAHNEISAAVAKNNFQEVEKKVVSYKYLYEYFEKASKQPLYAPLLSAAKSKNKEEVLGLLDRSLALEVDELLVQVEGMFDKYQASRLRLVKAKKHLQVLTDDKKPMKLMKKILSSIGNPGLMGVGQRAPDKDMFMKNKNLLLQLINQRSAKS